MVVESKGSLFFQIEIKVKLTQCKGRVGVTGFYARHFSVSQLRGGGSYLLSVGDLPSPSPKEASYLFIFPGR